MQTREGFINFKGFRTYYIMYGDVAGEKTPLLALHGGPGYTHYHLENLSGLAERGQPLVLYDQLGCGKSARPDNPKLWTIEVFIDELNAVRKSLGLDLLNLLGHSWGGSLAAEYMLTKPAGVKKLILSSPLLDSKLWVVEAKRLVNELPAWATALMRKHEAEGTTDSYEYQQAYMEFKTRFICRAKPYPMPLVKADEAAGAQVYETMWGPSETHATGSLKNWSVLDRLHEIDTPTLFLSGKYDEATPKQIEIAHRNIPGSKWVLFEHSSHTANFEETEKYLEAVEEFLDSA
ncbi:MAG TPA: proline iminopeptidase-family hydrolase [Candidatus Saccharimonadales bacterium]|jgi:proline-specific peptidase